jgi:hypothetical protein
MKNPIQEWINSDERLFELIIEIQTAHEDPNKQAEIAFNKLCDIYEIPKMPDDTISIAKNTENNQQSRSLFEEHALLKYLAPDTEDPRGLVLSAAHNLLHSNTIDYYEIVKKEYKNKIPELCQIGLSGNGFYSKVVFFEKETKNWEDLDCLTITSINKKTQY